MQFESIGDFFAMGGHALYVWLAYGGTVLVLLANHFAARGALKEELNKLKWQSKEE
jgi:heme exporter protein D